MKKRKLAAVLALAVALTVAGCGDKKESTQENTKTETQDTKTETDEDPAGLYADHADRDLGCIWSGHDLQYELLHGNQ